VVVVGFVEIYENYFCMNKKPPIPVKIFKMGDEYWIILLSDGSLMEIKRAQELTDLFIRLIQPTMSETIDER
jgi:hypothetical protein